MNYKKIIKSRKLRLRILKALNFLPDGLMLKIQYRLHTGHKLNLDNPQRFTEKLQWYKLKYRKAAMSQCVDKYLVRRYVEDKGLAEILNPCYGVFDKYEDIDFDSLPGSFVIKDTLGGGGTSVIIVKDKSKIDHAQLKATLDGWVKSANKKKKHIAREWVYENKQNRIVIDKYIEPENPETGITDIKLHCFYGKVRFINVISDRKLGQRSPFVWLDADFNRLPITWLDEDVLEKDVPKPENFDQIVKVAEKLSEDFPYVRVDLYNEFGKIIFGELTFFHASGYMKFSPDSADYDLGKFFDVERAKAEIRDHLPTKP